MRGAEVMKYKWRESCHFGADPQAVGERLVALRGELGRPLQRVDVYEDARAADSPFHKEVFRLGDEEAARQHRLEIAGQILRGIVVVTVVEDKSRPSEEAVEITQPLIQHVPEQGYELMQTVLSDVDLRRQALAAIVSGLETWRIKLKQFETLAEKFDAIIAEAKIMLEAPPANDQPKKAPRKATKKTPEKRAA